MNTKRILGVVPERERLRIATVLRVFSLSFLPSSMELGENNWSARMWRRGSGSHRAGFFQETGSMIHSRAAVVWKSLRRLNGFFR